MSDLTSLDNLYLIVGFLAPGLIVLFVRSQFVTGRISPDLGAIQTIEFWPCTEEETSNAPR